MCKLWTPFARSVVVSLIVFIAGSACAAVSDPAAITPTKVAQCPTTTAPVTATTNSAKTTEAGLSATYLAGLVSLILALSVASERLVEIVKGFIPPLNNAIAVTDDPKSKNEEARRQAYLQILAVIAGVFTAFMARDYIPKEIAAPTETWKIIGMGLLASGGSGFWNSVLTYVTKVKDLKKVEAEEAKRAVEK